MSSVTVLSRAEWPHIDMVQIEALYRNLGPFGAEALIASVLDDLTLRLQDVHALRDTAPPEELYKALRATAEAAEQVGIAGIAQTARDAMLCIEDADPVAGAATLARLRRLGDGVAGALNAVGGARG
jgi:hypothetical protein